MSALSEPLKLLLDDGRPGHFRQVDALSRYLPGRNRVVSVQLHQPWLAFAPRRLPRGWWFHPAIRQQLPQETPTVILSCGRRAALVARWLSGLWRPGPATVQILHSGLRPDRFSWLVTPLHDGVSGRNVIHTLGALNPVDSAWLGQDQYRSVDTTRPPRIGVLLGGPSKHFRFDRAWLEDLVRHLERVQTITGARLRWVTSPRTPAWVTSTIAALITAAVEGSETRRDAVPQVSGDHTVISWDSSRQTEMQAAYRQTLGWATHLVASADSINLLSEACASGRVVFVAGAERVAGRVARGIDRFVTGGYALDINRLEQAISDGTRTLQLQETRTVADRLLAAGLVGEASATH